MNFLLSFLGKGIVSIFGDAILKPILGHLDAKAAANRDIVVAQTGSDERRDIALVQGQIEANRLRASAQPEFMLLIYAIALGPVLHFAAVFLDSTPFWTPWGAHVVGAWQVPQVPEPYSTYEGQILLSFFLLSPVLAVAKSAAGALARR